MEKLNFITMVMSSLGGAGIWTHAEGLVEQTLYSSQTFAETLTEMTESCWRIGVAIYLNAVDSSFGRIPLTSSPNPFFLRNKLNMEGMATSMADHLRAHEYSRIRRTATTVLTEPPVSDEAAAILAEAYERDETSPEEYLSVVTQQRAFTPAATSHAVVISTGSYCSNTAVPVILKAFLQDHGNAVVKEVLSHHGVAMLEKIPSGGVLVHVRTAEDASRLAGQDVNLLGRKFKIKRQSLLMNKLFMDVSGIHSTKEANALFLALCAMGARPLFLTPRDVNMETQVTTPTWRYYFGSIDPPQCLMVHHYVAHQLVYGRNFYVARGKHSMEPPTRATTYRQSRYAVVLPFGNERIQPAGNGKPRKENEPGIPATSTALITAQVNSAADAPDAACASAEFDYELGDELMSPDPNHSQAILSQEPQEPNPSNALPGTVSADEPSSPNWTTHGDSIFDIDMSKQLETGFKRAEPSFAHENPFTALETPECGFELIQPQTSQGAPTGVVIIPHLKQKNRDEQARPAPTKKRATGHDQSAPDDDITLEEASLLSEQEAQLMTQNDRVANNAQHHQTTQTLLNGSKNMDQVVKSVCTVPLAWTKTFLEDIIAGGQQILELADIHVWNRVLAAEDMDDDDIRTFHDRITSLNLPMGNSRDQYTSYLKAVFDHLPTKDQHAWNMLRWLSIFELLALSMCPSIFTQQSWLQYLVEDADAGLPHTEVKLLSDWSLLQLLRSVLGKMVLTAIATAAPGTALLKGLVALRESTLSQHDLPVLSTTLLTSSSPVASMEVDTSN